ncbi:KH domain-containing protein [Candidatus Sumerlaeota bacterium]|nr:KH domain-containing protein [Candidatus Sumerlaeota bacterium]
MEFLPEGPWHYPADDVSDRDLRFLCAELVREKTFEFLHQELPYGIATWTEEWEENPKRPTRMRIVIQTEREAHKRIIIGAGGEMLKKIGTAARREIELLCGSPVFLELWVRVRERWRKDSGELDRLGLRQRSD